MTIVELLEKDGITAKRVKSTYGEKYESPCPLCKGTNRFQVWTNNGNNENFWCRKCGQSGNIISYLMHVKGMDYEQAVALSGKTDSWSHRKRNISVKQEIPAPVNKEQTNKQWQKQSIAFLEWSINCLWKENYTFVRDWLKKDRGLNEDTIKRAKLGWLHEDWYTERKIWGLPEKFKEDGHETKLLIPNGLIIPCFHNDELQRIKIRKHNITEETQYHVLSGSALMPMILGEGDCWVVVESELDALLLKQEAGDIARIMALGSAYMRPDGNIFNLLIKSEKILVALDNDDTGAKESWRWWLCNFSNAIRWPVIMGKDPTEAHMKGLNLKNWVRAGLDSGQRKILVAHHSPDTKERMEEQQHDDFITKKLEQLNVASIIAFHTGTSGKQSGVVLSELAIYSPDHEPVLLDVAKATQEVTKCLRELLNGKALKVFYDAKKTLHVFHSYGLEINNPLYDVMLADRILSAGTGFNKTLQDTVTYYGKAKGNQTLVEEVKILMDLKDHTLSRLTKNNLMDTAALEFDCIRVTMEMEKNGIRVNKEKLLDMLNKYLQLKSNLKSTLRHEFGGINLNSSKQVYEALRSKNIWVMSTKQEDLMGFTERYPFISDYISYKKTAHGLSLIGNLLSKISKATGRLHSSYSQIGAPTGRFSCANPNLQGIPRDNEFRSCFIPDDGYKFVIADYSQIELRIVAEMSQDKKMVEAYQQGKDLHKLTASVITGKSMSHITKEERNAAKAVNFGLIYAMGARKLKEYSLNEYGVSLTDEQATKFRKKFFETYEGIAKWHQDIKINFIYESRTLGNRWRTWDCNEGYGYGYGNYVTLAEKFNTPVQGTSADITKKALCILHDRLKGTGIRIVGCIHDEIIIEAPAVIVETAVDILRGAMVEAGGIYLKQVPVVVDTCIADNWSEK